MCLVHVSPSPFLFLKNIFFPFLSCWSPNTRMGRMDAGPQSPLLFISEPQAVCQWPGRGPAPYGMSQEGQRDHWRRFVPGGSCVTLNLSPRCRCRAGHLGLKAQYASRLEPKPGVLPCHLSGFHFSTPPPVFTAPILAWSPPSFSGSTKAIISLPACSHLPLLLVPMLPQGPLP